MGGGSKQTIGYRYSIGAHMVLCRGPVDSLLSIQVQKKDVSFTGSGEGGALTINQPELFGGTSREGGIVGTVDLEMGANDQGVNDYLEAQQGVGVTPAYRGVVAAVLRQVEIGMNPYLKPWAFRTKRILKRQDGIAQWYPEKAGIFRLETVEEVQSQALVIEADGDNQDAVVENGASRTITYQNTLQEDDIVVIIISSRLSIASNFTFSTSGWSEPTLPGVGWTWVEVRFKRMGSTPDTDVQITNNGGNAGIFQYFVVRGARTDGNPFRETPSSAINNATGTSSLVDPPAATPVDLNDLGILIGNHDDPQSTPQSLTGWTRRAWAYRGGGSGSQTGFIYTRNPSDLDEEDPGTVDMGTPDGWGSAHLHIAPGEAVSTTEFVDMNPAHMIREAITDPEWGMGYAEADIGSSFVAAADVLYDEGFGLSATWERQSEVEDFIQEVLAHIDAQVYVDNVTGLWEIKLIRDDYEVGSLPVLDDSSVMSLGNNVERIDPVEAPNTITVRFTHPTSGERTSITVHDQALVSEAGTIRATSLDFEFLHSEPLASRVAMRELLALSSPILSGSITVDRKTPELKPGSPFVLNLPRYYIDNEVMRVTGITYDEKNSEEVVLSVASDVFALADAATVNSDGSASTSYQNSPQPVTRRLVEEAPYWSVAQQLGDGEAGTRTSDRPELGFLQVAGESPTPDAVSANVAVDPDGAGFVVQGAMDFYSTATLDGALSADPGSTSITVKDASDLEDVVVGTLATIGGTEMVRVDGVSGLDVTIGRGCLDTVPVAHADEEPVIFWGDDPDATDQTEYADAESVDVKLLTVTGLGQLAEASAPTDTLVFDSRAARPLPVGKLQLDGEYVPAATLDNTDEVLTWAHRDRLTQTSTSIDDFTAGNIGPETGVGYTVLITWRDINGDQVGADLVNTSVGTDVTYTLTSGYMASRPGGAVELWFQVQTLRDTLREWTTPTIKATLP